MKFSFNCPACKKKLGIMALFFSIIPFFIRCHRCSSSIRIKNVYIYIFLNIMVSGATMLAYILASFQKYKSINIFFLMIIFIIFSYISLIIISNKANFEIHKNRYNSKEKKTPSIPKKNI